MQDKELYQHILGLTAPWTVTKATPALDPYFTDASLVDYSLEPHWHDDG